MFKNKDEEEEELNVKAKPKTPSDDPNSLTDEYKWVFRVLLFMHLEKRP